MQHAVAVGVDARVVGDVDAVRRQPLGNGEQVGIGDGVAVAQHPWARQQLRFDQLEAGGHDLGRLALHLGDGAGVVRPALTAAAVGVGHVDGGAQVAVEGLNPGEIEGVVQRRELRLGIALGDVAEDGRSLGKHAALGLQDRNAPLGIDAPIGFGALFGRGEIHPPQLEIGTGLAQRDV